MADPKLASISPKEAGYTNLGVAFDRSSTRGDGKVELGEEFSRESIDFGSVLDHLKIHQGGEVAGSQFNNEFVPEIDDVKTLLMKNLPETLQYDQHGLVELTLDIESPMPIGWTGVKSIDEIKSSFPNARIEKKMRMPGGMESEEDGLEGAWYPEMARDSQTGRFEVVKDEQGNIKNPKGKFEPKANIVTIPSAEYREGAATSKLTVIIKKLGEPGVPTVLTAYPGEGAPAFPAKIASADYQSDTLKDPMMNNYWENHAFIQTT